MKKLLPACLLLSLISGPSIAQEEAQVPVTSNQSSSAMEASQQSTKFKDSLSTLFYENATSYFSKMLDGYTPGLQATNGGGQPGSDASLLIRGPVSSDLQDHPMIVIDGAMYTGDLSSINPMDIDRIEVLKDALSLVKYGIRGSYGVIEIYTKSKNRQGRQLNIDAKAGISTMGLSDYNYMKSEKDYYEMAYRSYQTIPIGTPTSANFVDYLGNYNAYNISNDLLMVADGSGNNIVNPNANLRYHDDWKKEMMRTGFKQEYNISSANEGKVGQYYLSAGYLNDQGYVKNTGFERFSSSFNGSVNVLPWLKAGLHAMGTISDQDFINTGLVYDNPFYVYRNIAPIYPVYSRDNNGEKLIDPTTGKAVYDYNESRPFMSNQNVVSALLEDKRNYKSNTFLLNPYIQASFLNQFTVSAHYQLNNTKNNTSIEETIRDASPYTRSGEKNFKLNSTSYILNADWNKTFGEHHFLLNAGYESYTLKYDLKTAFISNGGINSSLLQNDQNSIEDFKGGLIYSYSKRYIFSANINHEGTSYSSPNNKYNTYWAIGLAYRLNEEKFLKNVSWMNLLQVSANYGLQGLQNDVGTNGFVYYNIKKPSTQFNTKIELVAFNNRFNFSAELYKKKSLSVIPALFPSLLTAYVQNAGIELSIGSVLIESSNFQWSTNVSATHNKNKMMDFSSKSVSSNPFLKEGNSMFDITVPEYAGVDPNNGKALYYKGVEKTSAYNTLRLDDYKNHGSSLPTFYGSLTNNLHYKQFELSIQLNYSIGGKYYDGIYQNLMATDAGNRGNNYSEDIQNAWTPLNQITDIPSVSGVNLYTNATSSRFLRNASYLNFKRATLSYNITAPALQKAKLKSLKIYLAGDNLFLLTDKKGMNPQGSFTGNPGYAYVPARSIILGINIGL